MGDSVRLITGRENERKKKKLLYFKDTQLNDNL